jgi:hypothetical protein
MKKAKKAKAKKAKAKKAKKVAGAPTGCCTLRGNGPNLQREGITREQCRILANSLDKEFSWTPGLCAEAD